MADSDFADEQYEADEQDELDIAVIGMACRFPGAKNTEEFWHNLREGVESVSFFSDEELIAAGADPALLKNPACIKAWAVLPDIERFDAPFFGFSPREAELLDPQQRLFLECAWESLEHAGYQPDSHPGRTGVYAGVGINTYLQHNLYANQAIMEAVDTFQLMLANDKDFLSTRVSYKLNLTGSGVNVQTACSSSLTAVHFACQGLLNGESDMALAGGVRVHLPQKAVYLHQKGGILSPDGHCRAFDVRAQGIVGGSGAGIVVLKRLSDALADGDTVHAVIKSTAINNDGAQKVGFTAPSVEGQAAVIADAQAIAGVDPDTVTYVEAHGTATELGDPIEIAALTQAFHKGTAKKNFCAIGSAKTNFGHLDAAAGVAALIKTVLALKHRQIPPSLHFTRPNPNIDLANSPFYVNTALTDWTPPGTTPRRAGVSSFGIGGTNAHAVLEEAPVAAYRETDAGGENLLLLSARTAAALDAAGRNLVHGSGSFRTPLME